MRFSNKWHFISSCNDWRTTNPTSFDEVHVTVPTRAFSQNVEEEIFVPCSWCPGSGSWDEVVVF